MRATRAMVMTIAATVIATGMPATFATAAQAPTSVTSLLSPSSRGFESSGDSTSAALPDGWESVTVQLKPTNSKAMQLLVHGKHLGNAERSRTLRSALATPTAQNSVANFLRKAGFTVMRVSPIAVTAAGPAPLISAVFGQPALPHNFHPTATTPTSSAIPSPIAKLVSFVAASNQGSIHFNPHFANFGHVSTTPRGFNCPSACIEGPNFPALYDVPAKALASTTAGAGITIATLQFSGWDAGSLTNFATHYQLPDPVASGQYTAVAIDGADPTAPDSSGGDSEVALDQETLLAVAPRAQQVAYFAPNTLQGEIDALNQIANDAINHVGGRRYTALSISWGQCEATTPVSELNSISQAVATVVAAGVTVFAASGDSGAYDCSTSTVPDSRISVDYPASDPHVIGVGGLETNVNPISETTWWDPNPVGSAYAGSGSGGGISTHWLQTDAAWQARKQANSHRLVPDIALNAAPSTGEPIAIGTSWFLFGGTSLAAPLAAATLTDIQIAQGPTSSYGLGNIAPILYSAPASSFRDTTTGSNGVYDAATGYDLTTGLGAPMWAHLASSLFGAPSVSAPTVTNSRVVPVSYSVPTGFHYVSYVTGSDIASEPTNCIAPINASRSIPSSFTVPADGTYTFWIVGYLSATTCNVGETIVRVDTVAPTTVLTTPTHGFSLGQAIGVTWTSADPNGSGVATTAVRYARTSATSSASPVWSNWWNATSSKSATFANAALASTYCFEVRATDLAGNTGNWSAPRCTSTAFDDRWLKPSTGWQRGTTSTYLASTYTATTRLNSILASRSSVSVRHVGLIAMRCPTCGTVGIYLDSALVGTLSLKQSTTTRSLITLPAFATAKSGVVRFKVLTTGRLVRIDAALLSS